MTKSTVPSYDHVLIVGNGFDLDLGLPTSYADFLASKQFEKLIFRGNEIAAHLKRKFEIQNWVDVEGELPVLSRINADRTEAFHKEYIGIRDSLFDYIESIDCSSMNMECLGASVLKGLASNAESLLVINFNYTIAAHDALVQVKPQKKDIRYEWVHGNINRNDRLVVFGVQDKADIDPRHAFLLKSTSPVLQDQWSVGQAMVQAKKSVTLFGHSLGETDHSQFRRFFSSANKGSVSVRCYYHSIESHDELLSQIYSLTEREFDRFRYQHDFQMCGPCYDQL